MKKVTLTDAKRDEVKKSLFKRPYPEELGEKHRKGLVVLSVFSLILNYGGVEVTGSSIGLISGKITHPEIISIALFVATLYQLITYLLSFKVVHEGWVLDHYEHKLETFKKLAMQSLINDQLEHFLTRSGQFKVEVLPYSPQYKFMFKDPKGMGGLLFLTKIRQNSYDKTLILGRLQHFSSEIEMIDSEGSGDYVLNLYRWIYEMRPEDIKYYERNARHVKYMAWQNIAFYRAPYILAIWSLFSYI